MGERPVEFPGLLYVSAAALVALLGCAVHISSCLDHPSAAYLAVRVDSFYNSCTGGSLYPCVLEVVLVERSALAVEEYRLVYGLAPLVSSDPSRGPTVLNVF